MVKRSPASKLKKNLEELKKKAQKYYYVELKKRLSSQQVRNFYIKRAQDVLDEMQSAYFEGGGEATKEDPTQLGRDTYKTAIAAEINNNFDRAVGGLQLGSPTLGIELLSDRFIGRGKEGDKTGNQPIQWLVFFLDGDLEDNLYWINKDLHEKLHFKDRTLGRFGVGYLVKLQESTVANFTNRGINMAAHRHPQSGKPGRDWFDPVLDDASFYDLVIAPAINIMEQKIQVDISKFNR